MRLGSRLFAVAMAKDRGTARLCSSMTCRSSRTSLSHWHRRGWTGRRQADLHLRQVDEHPLPDGAAVLVVEEANLATITACRPGVPSPPSSMLRRISVVITLWASRETRSPAALPRLRRGAAVVAELLFDRALMGGDDPCLGQCAPPSSPPRPSCRCRWWRPYAVAVGQRLDGVGLEGIQVNRGSPAIRASRPVTHRGTARDPASAPPRGRRGAAHGVPIADP